ncbi:MAG TPA: hypothetical protein VMI31_05685 [Fimbriimonadaceae bacterium]|nr:hypothetical protein [Fimbriimonadaceae bacterium]
MRLATDFRIFIRRRGENLIEMLCISNDRKCSQSLRSNAGERMLQQRNRPTSRSCNVMAGDDFQAHFGWTPVFITKSRDHSVSCSVIPNVEQTSCTPATHPVVRPTGRIEYRIPRLPSMPGQGSKFLGVAVTVSARHQIQTEGKKGVDANATSQTPDLPGNTALSHARRIR